VVLADDPGAKRLGEALASEWFRLMRAAKDRAGRREVQGTFRRVMAELKGVYGAGGSSAPSPWAALLRGLPPPLPIDPLGQAIYKQLQKSARGADGAGGDFCGLCAAQDFIDAMEERVCVGAGVKDPGGCVVDCTEVVYRALMGLDPQEGLEARVMAVALKHGVKE